MQSQDLNPRILSNIHAFNYSATLLFNRYIHHKVLKTSWAQLAKLTGHAYQLIACKQLHIICLYVLVPKIYVSFLFISLLYVLIRYIGTQLLKAIA